MAKPQGWGTALRARDRVVLFDFDGTLSDHGPRLPLVTGTKKKNFKAYYEAMGEDKPIVSVAQLYVELKSLGFAIHIATGRPDEYRLRTLDWLSRNGLPHPAELHMRAPKNEVENHQLKRSIATTIGPRKIWLALDDDAKVCLEYAELGICAFMVARQ